MLRPSRNLDDKSNKNQAGGYCSDMASGDFGKFWKGPTRLSLIDSAEMKLINTIEIRASCLGCKANTRSRSRSAFSTRMLTDGPRRLTERKNRIWT